MVGRDFFSVSCGYFLGSVRISLGFLAGFFRVSVLGLLRRWGWLGGGSHLY